MPPALLGVLPNRFLRNLLKKALFLLFFSSLAYFFVYTLMGRQAVVEKLPFHAIGRVHEDSKAAANENGTSAKPDESLDWKNSENMPGVAIDRALNPPRNASVTQAIALDAPPRQRQGQRRLPSDAADAFANRKGLATKRSKNGEQFLRLINAPDTYDADDPAAPVVRPGAAATGGNLNDDGNDPSSLSNSSTPLVDDGRRPEPASFLGRRQKFLRSDLNLGGKLKVNLNLLKESWAADEQRRRLRADFLNKSGGSAENRRLPVCDEPSPLLVGKLKEATLLMVSLKEEEVRDSHPDLKIGGNWQPQHCRARYKVAIIVPFRDRQTHLTRLIDFLVPLLKRQLLDFSFIVTEQYGSDLFNKGRIMNAAFHFAVDYLKVDCVVFHDVDMFPQDDRNFYGCPDEPRHIGAYVNTLGYELWYNYIVGGVLAISVEHYVQINGYSNMFWAWGGEDDDMGLRILANNLTIERPDPVIGRMTMIKHVKRQKLAPSLVGNLLKSSGTRWVNDGLNFTQWSIINVEKKPLYFHLYVDVGTAPEEWRNDKGKPKK